MHLCMAKGDPLSDDVAKKAWGARGQKRRAGPAAGEREPRGAADVEQASAAGFDDALGCDGIMDMLVDAPVSGEPADSEADDAGEPEDTDGGRCGGVLWSLWAGQRRGGVQRVLQARLGARRD